MQGIRATLGDLECTVANLSSTGAMLRIRTEVPAGREAALVIDLPAPVKTKVRVVHAQARVLILPSTS